MHHHSSNVYSKLDPSGLGLLQREYEVSNDLHNATNITGLCAETKSETAETPQSTTEDQQTAYPHNNKSLDKATKEFVMNWIQENYEEEADQSVARNEAYEHYAFFCESLNLRPINSALFGKLIRSVFPNMKTRRLGTRGASKYHYGGIKRKDGVSGSAYRPQPVSSTVSPMNTSISAISYISQESPLTSNQPTLQFDSDMQSPATHSMSTESLVPALPLLTTSVTGSSESPFNLPRFFAPTLYNDTAEIAGESFIVLAADFTRLYSNHCQSVLKVVQEDQWTKVRKELMDFWYGMDARYSRFLRECNEIVEAIWRWDSALYDCILANAIPDVSAKIPTQKTTSIRQFSSQFEKWVTESIKSFSAELNQQKIDVAKIFVSKLRHSVLINHEAKLAAQVIEDEERMAELRTDWAGIDLAMVIDQATWVCECRADQVENIVVKDIVSLLQDSKHLDDWIAWLKKLTSSLMIKTMDAGRFVHHARQIILKWSHYSSALEKDFCLRSAASLGTFMVLRMFVDDYLISLVESHIAELNIRLARPTAPPIEEEGRTEVSDGESANSLAHTSKPKSPSSPSSKPPFHIVFHRFR
ncbi:Transcription factor rfx3 [Umbelopsis sp. WA50703]